MNKYIWIIAASLMINRAQLLGQPIPISINEDTVGVIFPQDYTKKGGPFKWLNKRLNKKRFTPTSSEIIEVEEFLSKKNIEILALLNSDRSKSNTLSSLDLKEYYRQYFGYFDDGRKVVNIRFYKKKYINLLGFNWKTESIDGYSCVIVLDIENYSFVEGFYFNSKF